MKETLEPALRSDLQSQVRGDRRRIDLHRLEELSDSVSVDDPRDRSHCEDLTGLRKGQRAYGKKTILFDKETTRNPLPGMPTIDIISSAVLRGVFHEGRLIGRVARNQEQEGNRNTRVRQVWAIRTM